MIAMPWDRWAQMRRSAWAWVALHLFRRPAPTGSMSKPRPSTTYSPCMISSTGQASSPTTNRSCALPAIVPMPWRKWVDRVVFPESVICPLSCMASMGVCRWMSSGDLIRENEDNTGEPVLIDPPNMAGSEMPLIATGEGIPMEQNCFNCHPGKITQCFRGAMYTAGQKCDDCHGDMLAMGGEFPLLTTGDAREPWADEPKCSACHSGHGGDPVGALAYDPPTPQPHRSNWPTPVLPKTPIPCTATVSITTRVSRAKPVMAVRMPSGPTGIRMPTTMSLQSSYRDMREPSGSARSVTNPTASRMEPSMGRMVCTRSMTPTGSRAGVISTTRTLSGTTVKTSAPPAMVQTTVAPACHVFRSTAY